MAQEARDREILLGSLSAIRRFPEEVLSIIFQAYVLDHGGSPWTLTQVSSLFRKAAFTSRSVSAQLPTVLCLWPPRKIWVKVELRHGDVLDPNMRNQSGREICTNASQLRLALGRSGTAPLDIKFSSFDVDMAREIVKTRERWWIFNLNNKLWDHQLLQWLFTETQLPIPLESVVLIGLAHRDYVQQWLNVAQPGGLDLKKPCDLVGLTAQSWSRNLRVLSIQDPLVSLHIPEILTRTASGLTHLSLTRVQLQLELMPSSIACPNLLDLLLIDVNAWWQFGSPRLRTLTLYPTCSMPEFIGVSYPSLKKLVYSAQKSLIPPGCIFAPALESLTLQWVSLAPGRLFTSVIPGWFQGSSNMRLRHLSIRGCSVPYKEFIESLYLLSHLEVLRIIDTLLPVSFFRALGSPGSSRNGVLCPALQDLMVDFSLGKSNMVKETLVAAFEDVVKLREKMLVKFRVDWPTKWKVAPTFFVGIVGTS